MAEINLLSGKLSASYNDKGIQINSPIVLFRPVNLYFREMKTSYKESVLHIFRRMSKGERQIIRESFSLSDEKDEVYFFTGRCAAYLVSCSLFWGKVDLPFEINEVLYACNINYMRSILYIDYHLDRELFDLAFEFMELFAFSFSQIAYDIQDRIYYHIRTINDYLLRAQKEFYEQKLRLESKLQARRRQRNRRRRNRTPVCSSSRSNPCSSSSTSSSSSSRKCSSSSSSSSSSCSETSRLSCEQTYHSEYGSCTESSSPRTDCYTQGSPCRHTGPCLPVCHHRDYRRDSRGCSSSPPCQGTCECKSCDVYRLHGSPAEERRIILRPVDSESGTVVSGVIEHHPLTEELKKLKQQMDILQKKVDILEQGHLQSEFSINL